MYTWIKHPEPIIRVGKQGEIADVEEVQIQTEQVVEVHRAILKLPPHYRAVIELRHYQDLSYAEIADELQIPISDVKSHLYRARKSLAKDLKKHE